MFHKVHWEDFAMLVLDKGGVWQEVPLEVLWRDPQARTALEEMRHTLEGNSALGYCDLGDCRFVRRGSVDDVRYQSQPLQQIPG